MNRCTAALAAILLVIAAACGENQELTLVDEDAEVGQSASLEDDASTEQQTNTSKPTTTTRKPTTTTAPPSGTAANPDPLGSSYELTSDGMSGKQTWRVTLDAVDIDGWPAIQAENQFNSPPADGWRFVIVEMTVGYVDGSGPESPGWQFDLTATGSANRVYNEYSDMPNGESGCGVTPNDLAFHDQLMPGGSATGNVCLPIPDAEIADGSLRLLLGPAFSWDDDDTQWVTPFA